MGVPVTVTIDSELLAQVRERGLDVVQILEIEIGRRLEKERAAREWYEQNKDAVDSYRAHVEEHGVAGRNRGLRRF